MLDLARDRCPCSGRYEERLVEVNMTVQGERVTLSEVPQRACPVCGSRVYSPPTLERIEMLMKTAPRGA